MDLSIKNLSQTIGKRPGLTSFCAALGLLSGSAHAEWLLLPTASIESQHSSNFQLFSGENQQRDSLFSHSVLAGVDISNQTERTTINGRAELSYSSYTNDRLLEDTDRQYFELELRRRYDRGALGLSLSVRRDDLLRFVGSLSDPDDALNDGGDDLELGLTDPNIDLNFETTQIGRTTSIVKTLSQYRLTERNSLRFNYTFVNRDVDSTDEQDLIGVLPNGNTRHTVDLSFQRSLSRRSRLRWNNRVSLNDTGTLDDVYIFESSLGWSSSLGEQTNITTNVGVTRTSGAPENRTGLVTRASLQHTVSWGSISAGVSRSFRPTLRGNVTETDTLQLSFQTQLSPSLSLNFDASGNRRQRSADTDIEDNNEFFRLGPRLTYALTPKWAVSAGYEFRRVKRDREFASGSANDHAGILSVLYTPAGIRL